MLALASEAGMIAVNRYNILQTVKTSIINIFILF